MARPKRMAVADPSADESALPMRDESGLMVKSEKAPRKATLTYETLMGLACPGPSGYRYLEAGSLVEFDPEEAAALLTAGAIRLAE